MSIAPGSMSVANTCSGQSLPLLPICSRNSMAIE
jgi:hypothetical protein